tara:strand:+ start:24324 stop:25016 length:693 start_codon:yes stop_codon:yes gene_type:complete
MSETRETVLREYSACDFIHYNQANEFPQSDGVCFALTLAHTCSLVNYLTPYSSIAKHSFWCNAKQAPGQFKSKMLTLQAAYTPPALGLCDYIHRHHLNPNGLGYASELMNDTCQVKCQLNTLNTKNLIQTLHQYDVSVWIRLYRYNSTDCHVLSITSLTNNGTKYFYVFDANSGETKFIASSTASNPLLQDYRKKGITTYINEHLSYYQQNGYGNYRLLFITKNKLSMRH